MNKENKKASAETEAKLAYDMALTKTLPQTHENVNMLKLWQQGWDKYYAAEMTLYQYTKFCERHNFLMF